MSDITDKERLDFLQDITGSYTGKVTCRWSLTGRGWRLHETSEVGGVSNVREAIDKMMEEVSQ